jgi:hypothetical protein
LFCFDFRRPITIKNETTIDHLSNLIVVTRKRR